MIADSLLRSRLGDDGFISRECGSGVGITVAIMRWRYATARAAVVLAGVVFAGACSMESARDADTSAQSDSEGVADAGVTEGARSTETGRLAVLAPAPTSQTARPVDSEDRVGDSENGEGKNSADSPPSPHDSTPPPQPAPTPTSQPVSPQAVAGIELVLEPVADIADPIAMATKPDTGQRYVASRTGQVWLLDPGGRDGEPQKVADLGSSVSRGCENGLLGLAFAPDGSQMYLSYTNTAGDSRITVAPMDGDVAQMDRNRVLLAVPQPACNHNGGDLTIGPDGMLWIGFGDGGAANDIFGNGQDTETLLGSMVRVDPAPPSGRGYGIPDRNPFTSGGAPEIWAYGARNPWRFSFDLHTGDLWIADVGQNRWEEIHILEAADGWLPGANLGWPLFEGIERFAANVVSNSNGANSGGTHGGATGSGADGSGADGAGSDLPPDLVFPAYVYGHDEGCSVTGGHVYRGHQIADLWGTYVFGDYCTGALWGLVAGTDGLLERVDLGVDVPRNSLVSFGTDADGEIYVLSSAGTVYRLDPAPNQ